ncbi:MAG: M48 family metallopeptidase [Paludibacter sp.]|nr:M48 family metallopeptidase [Paludibacter sp.]
MKRLLLVCFSTLLMTTLFSQLYIPIDTANFQFRKDKSKKYLEESKLFITKLKADYKGSDKSYIKTEYEKSQKEFNEEILHGDYLFDIRFDHFVDSIVARLREDNPMIPADLRFFISKNLSLNASSMGDNTFVINLGTFYYLDNEDEFATIISHEIGHFILKHQILSLQRHFKIDKVDSKKQLGKIKSDRYSRGAKALERFKAIMYSEGTINRKKEQEADSLGYTLFRNSKFHKADYLNSFILMAEYDSIKPEGLDLPIYHKIFTLPDLKFKEEWMKCEDFTGYDYSKYKPKLNSDSMKSHPENEERIARLKHLFPELSDSGEITKPGTAFIELQRIAKNELVPSLDFNEDYGGGVYLCLLNIQRDSTDNYHKQWLGHFFQKIYDARKSYTLNRYLDRVEPKDQSKSYQQFLNFMWNLNMMELKKIADYYSKKGS